MKTIKYITLTIVTISLLLCFSSISKKKKPPLEVIENTKSEERYIHNPKEIDELESIISLKESIEERRVNHLKSAQSVLERFENYYKGN